MKIHCIGNAHIDVAWLWRWQDGLAEVKATFLSALERMDTYDDFVFTCSSAAYYQWVEHNAPELFERIRQRVREGRWVLAGGWWVQPDCNLPSGESFVRQGLYGQRYFLEAFGKTSSFGYNVDSFGHNAMLPQILAKSGLNSYVFMRPNETENTQLPDLFLWESPDKTQITAFRLPVSYIHKIDAAGEDNDAKFTKTLELAEKNGHPYLFFYGVGNHGGGPTIANIKYIQSKQRKYGNETVCFSSPDVLFSEVSSRRLPVVNTDLLHHAIGCYSAHSKIKLFNHRAETRLQTAETMSSLAYCLLGASYPADTLRQAWQTVLFNQFHDVLAGCSIRDVCDDALEMLGGALSSAAKAQNNAVQKLSWAIDTDWLDNEALEKENDIKLWDVGGKGAPFVVFNSHSWDVETPVTINKKVGAVMDDTGQPIDTQLIRAQRTDIDDKWDTVFMARLPAWGYRVYRLLPESGKQSPAPADGDCSLENEWTRAEFGQQGLTLFDKTTASCLLEHGAAALMIDETDFDTWGHDKYIYSGKESEFHCAKPEVLYDGPLFKTIRVTGQCNQSRITQDFTLYHTCPDIFVEVALDWLEEHKVLKLSFSKELDDPIVLSQIPYGWIDRGKTFGEYPCQRWVHRGGKTEDAYAGVTIINDGKSSYDVTDSALRLTVLRSPQYADHFGERDKLSRYMDRGCHSFSYRICTHNQPAEPSRLTKNAYEFNQKPISVHETYHKGALPRMMRGISLGHESVVAPVFKESEDNRGFVLRCVETSGRPAQCGVQLLLLNRKWNVEFEPFEIKTFFIPKESGEPVREVNLLEL